MKFTCKRLSCPLCEHKPAAAATLLYLSGIVQSEDTATRWVKKGIVFVDGQQAVLGKKYPYDATIAVRRK